MKKTKDSKGWDSIILEQLLGEKNYEGISARHEKAGYIDYKHMYTADHDAGPISIKIKPRIEGMVYICEPTGFFGATAGKLTN